jgi:hypothetical protein
VSAGTTYYYKVSAVASDGSESPQSEYAFATFTGEIQVPAVSLQAALDWLNSNAEDGGAYAITLKSNESIAPRTLSYGSKIVSVTLKGDTSERKVSLKANGSLFTVGSGITLTLDSNVTLQGRSGNTASLVRVNGGGTLVMNTGSKISGNSASFYAGVYVYYGEFIMNGGEISGNSASYGGGVYVNSGTFTMNNGKISGNSASSFDGGGVYVSSNGTFTMSGGEISGNSAFFYGGGVYVSIGGSFTKQSGGTIHGANASSVLRNNANSGQAVYVNINLGSKQRNTTAGTGVTLDSTKSGAAGGWE